MENFTLEWINAPPPPKKEKKKEMHWNDVKFPLQEILPAWPIAASKAKVKNKFVSPYPTDPVKIDRLKKKYWKFAVIWLLLNFFYPQLSHSEKWCFQVFNAT